MVLYRSRTTNGAEENEKKNIVGIASPPNLKYNNKINLNRPAYCSNFVRCRPERDHVPLYTKPAALPGSVHASVAVTAAVRWSGPVAERARGLFVSFRSRAPLEVRRAAPRHGMGTARRHGMGTVRARNGSTCPP